MKCPIILKFVATLFIFIVCILPSGVSGEDKVPDSGKDQSGGLMKRIDFGTTHITGQTIKSGAVYLMHRKKSDIDSMLKVRQDYREEIRQQYGLEDSALSRENKNGDKGRK